MRLRQKQLCIVSCSLSAKRRRSETKARVIPDCMYDYRSGP